MIGRGGGIVVVVVGVLLTKAKKNQKQFERAQNSETYGVGGIGEVIREN